MGSSAVERPAHNGLRAGSTPAQSTKPNPAAPPPLRVERTLPLAAVAEPAEPIEIDP
jgi:hypothetical protein